MITLGYCEICSRSDVPIDYAGSDDQGPTGICARCWRSTPWAEEARKMLADHGACLCEDCMNALATLAADEAHAQSAEGRERETR